MFRKSGLKSIIIPSNVEFIGAGAFSKCENLFSVTIQGPILTISETYNTEGEGDEDKEFEEYYNREKENYLDNIEYKISVKIANDF